MSDADGMQGGESGQATASPDTRTGDQWRAARDAAARHYVETGSTTSRGLAIEAHGIAEGYGPAASREG